MNGAEPVSVTSLQAFADAFAPAGFRPEAFSPVYGLAEATLLVSGGSNSAVPVVAHIDRVALQQDRVVDAAPDDPTAATFVGCGHPQGGQQVIIVDPETRRPCGPDEVGEIWIAGPSVARGYWGRPEETEQTFSAFLSEADSDQFPGPFLRTGDLGFLRSGELFITGRVKDLITICGGNYYPNDIEQTVQDCHPALLSGRGAVFSVAPGEGSAEQFVVVQEMDRYRIREVKLADVVDAILASIAKHHGISVDTVLLVEPMRIPTTSSGKIQRGQCRQQFLDRELEAVFEWYAPLSPVDVTADLQEAQKAMLAQALLTEMVRRAASQV
jgi:fatty acid CoA ligase FadD32